MHRPQFTLKVCAWLARKVWALHQWMSRVLVVRVFWWPFGIVVRLVRLAVEGVPKIRCFHAIAWRAPGWRFAWRPVAAPVWLSFAIIGYIGFFIESIPYRFFAKVAGCLMIPVLSFLALQQFNAERRWLHFRHEAVAEGIPIRLPRTSPKCFPVAEDFVAAFPFRRDPFAARRWLTDSGWKPEQFLPSRGGRRPDFDARFPKKEIRRLWAQRLDDGPHLRRSRLRESSPTKPTPEVFLSFFDGRLRKPWDRVLAAEGKPRARFAVSLSEYGVPRPEVNSYELTKVAELHAQRAVSFIALGRGDEATGEIEGMWRIADALLLTPWTSLQSAALSIEHLAMDVIWYGLDRRVWTDKTLLKLDRRLAGRDFVAAGARYLTSARCEFNEMVEAAMERLWSDPLLRLRELSVDRLFRRDRNPFADLPNRVRILADETGVLKLYQSTDGYLRAEQVWLNQHLEEMRRATLCLSRTDRKSRTAKGMLATPVASVQAHPIAAFWAKRCRDQCVSYIRSVADQRLARTAIAIERFQRSHDRLPIGLGEMVPQFLDIEPVDPFDGQLMRYAADDSHAYRLWSVGENLTDEGGTTSFQKKKQIHTDVVWCRLPAE